MPHILRLKDVNRNSMELVGEKSLNIAILNKSNFPVPKSFIVTSDAHKTFLEDTRIDHKINNVLKNLDIEDSEKLKEVSKKIQDIILSSNIPQEIKNEITKEYSNLSINSELIDEATASTLRFITTGRENLFVAVRSSLIIENQINNNHLDKETYLNVRGQEQVLQAVHQCWASLYSEKHIYNRKKNNLENSQILMAVIIQKMVDSNKAGIMFSINPETNEDEILIEASYGLGDVVISKAVSPDRYRVDKGDLRIKGSQINKKEWMLYRDMNTGRTTKRILNDEKANSQVLTEEEIKRLSHLAKDIENHYNSPQNIEFAIEDNNIFIIQSKHSKEKKLLEKEVVQEQSIETQNSEDFRKNIILSFMNKAKNKDSYASGLIQCFIAFDAFNSEKFGINQPSKNRKNFCNEYGNLIENMYSSVEEEVNNIYEELEKEPLGDTGPYNLKKLSIEDKKDILRIFEILYRVRSNLMHGGNEMKNERNSKLIKNSFNLLYKVFDSVLKKERLL